MRRRLLQSCPGDRMLCRVQLSPRWIPRDLILPFKGLSTGRVHDAGECILDPAGALITRTFMR